MSLYEKYIGEIDPSQKKEEKPGDSKKSTFIFLILVLAIIILGFLQTPFFQNNPELENAEAVAAVLESYKRDNGIFPDTLSEVDISEDIDISNLTYVKVSEEVFEIHFVTKAGRNTTYNSSTKEWN